MKQVDVPWLHGWRSSRPLGPRQLKRLPVLENLPAEDLESLSASSVWVTFERSHSVAYPPYQSDATFLPVAGSIGVNVCGQSGRVLTLWLVEPGAFLIPRLLPSSVREATWIEAAEDGTVVLLLPAGFGCCRGARDMVEVQHEVVESELGRCVFELAFHDVASRVAHAIGRWAQQSDSDSSWVLHLAHAEIARLAGTSREDATRAIRQFVKLGLLSTSSHRREVHLRDREALLNWPPAIQ